MDVKCIGSNNQIETVACPNIPKNEVSYCACKHCDLGGGAYGKVYKGKIKKSGLIQEVAVKRVNIGNRDNEMSKDDLEKEANVMIGLIYLNNMRTS